MSRRTDGLRLILSYLLSSPHDSMHVAYAAVLTPPLGGCVEHLWQKFQEPSLDFLEIHKVLRQR